MIPPYRGVREEAGRLWRLGWPVSVGMAALSLMGTADTVMVGALGKEPLAAVAIGNMWSLGLAIIGHTGVRALDPLVAQAFGAGDRDGAGRALVRGWVVAALLAVPLCLLHLWTAEGLGWLGQPSQLLAPAEAYALARVWGLPFAIAFDATRQFLQGLGRMWPATWVMLAANLVNVAANAVFLYVLELGPAGCGLATAAANVFLFVGLLWVARSDLRAWWPPSAGLFAVRPIAKLLGEAIPAGLQSGLEVWAFIGAGLVVGTFGAAAVAAHAVALNLATMAFMVPFGFGAGAATRVGNLVGAGHSWSRSAWVAVGMGAAFMACSALVFTWFPLPLAHLYSRDPEVVDVVLVLLPIAALFQVFDGVQAVAFSALRGIGDIRVPTLANVLGHWCLGLPVGWWLAIHGGYGPRGVWYGLCLGLAVVAGLLLLRIADRARQPVAPGGRLAADLDVV